MKVDTDSNPNLVKLVDEQPGYFIGKMSESDLKLIKYFVEEHYYTRILSEHPEHSAELFSVPMNQYHLKSDLVNHQALWPKTSRILGPTAVKRIKSLDFFKWLTQAFTIEGITGEENSGWEEIYWRIVRPGKSDIGSMHADKWFWDLGHGKLESDKKRIKIWIALNTVPDKSGLKVVPNSHLDTEINFSGEVDHTGVVKPKLGIDESTLNSKNLATSPGDYVIFNDRLLHAGMENTSSFTRVSLEATLIVSK